MVAHHSITLTPKSRGIHIITQEILSHISVLPQDGLLHLFIQHTSAGLTINENADPDVLADFQDYMNQVVPENAPFLRHTIEGPDDMPAHVKASMMGSSISIPIVNGRLALGTWQGIYLCEFRNRSHQRKLIATIIS